MIRFFRFLIVFSIAVFALGVVLPFHRPLNIDLPLNGPLPTWLLGCIALFAAAITGVVASVGLLRFRKWGRFLGVCASVAALIGVFANVGSPIAGSIGFASGGMLVAGIVAWSSGVGLAFHPSVTSRFRA